MTFIDLKKAENNKLVKNILCRLQASSGMRETT